MKDINYVDSLLDSAELAKKFGLKVKEVKAVGNIKILTVECDKGHQWKTTFEKVSSGGAECKVCLGKYLNNNEKLIKAKWTALQNKGKLLSYKFVSDNSLLEWETESGVRFSSSYAMVVENGYWYLSKIELENRKIPYLERAKNFAKANHGECLTTGEAKRGEILKWQCSKGHKFEARFEEINNKRSFCKECKKNSQQKTKRRTKKD